MNKYQVVNSIDPTSYIGWILWILGLFIGLIVVFWAMNAVYQLYNVWASRKQGEAQLQHANRQQLIQVSEAEGRLKAAGLNKEAAIVEAQAVAKQIETIGQNLKEHDLYLKWQWIKMMEERKGSTIYVPTEAGLPILEAGKRG